MDKPIFLYFNRWSFCWRHLVNCKYLFLFKKIEIIVLRDKGSQSANAPGKHRQDQIVTRVGQRLHQNFRKTYINIKYISLANRENKTEESKIPSLWSTVAFDFQKHCLFCGMLSLVSGKKTWCVPSADVGLADKKNRSSL